MGRYFQQRCASCWNSGWHRHFFNSKFTVLFGVVVDGYGIIFRRGSSMKLLVTNPSKGTSICRVSFRWIVSHAACWVETLHFSSAAINGCVFVVRDGVVIFWYIKDTGSTNTPSNFCPVISTTTRSPAAKQCEGSAWERVRKRKPWKSSGDRSTGRVRPPFMDQSDG